MAIREIPVASGETLPVSNWVGNTALLWEHRRTLSRVFLVAAVLSTALAFAIPKRYESTVRLMPPEQPGGGAAVLAMLAGRSGGLGGLGSIAGSLLGARPSGALFIDLLHSRTISDRVIDRFNLQKLYRKRYRIDTVKILARHTTIADDKKSGVISLTVSDTDPQRARDMAQAYVEELNSVVTRSSVSSARREREFIEKRLVSVQSELLDAERALSEFSSTNTTLDIKEQTHAMVDAAAKLQGQLIAGQTELDGLKQIYGDENVRVRAAQARVAGLQHELSKMSGSSAIVPENTGQDADSKQLYPSLRQLPRLAVPYTNLYRRVRIQETVFELLSQQYEMARIEEAKDTPVVSVIDSPLIPEKTSFPVRRVTILAITGLSLGFACLFLLLRNRWEQVAPQDPRKILALEIRRTVQARLARYIPSLRGAQ
jgi:capsule polysaccharide export protein KpsE/RkpR